MDPTLIIVIVGALIALGLAIAYWPLVVLAIGIGLATGKINLPFGVSDVVPVIFAVLVLLGIFGWLADPKRKGSSAWSGTPSNTSQPCHVYIIADGYCHKVGIANDVARRLATLQTGHPNKLTLVRSFQLPSRAAAMAVESESHDWLARYRVGGEWFEADRAMIEHAVSLLAKKHGSGDVPSARSELATAWQKFKDECSKVGARS
jgi:Meiotically up-regulated gene 113